MGRKQFLEDAFLTTGWQLAGAICFPQMLRYTLKLVRLKITDCTVVWEKENPCCADMKVLILLDMQPGRNAKFPKDGVWLLITMQIRRGQSSNRTPVICLTSNKRGLTSCNEALPRAVMKERGPCLVQTVS